MSAKKGDKINVGELSRQLGCKVVEISALKSDGIEAAADAAIDAAKNTKTIPQHTFSGVVEHALAHIEEVTVHSLPEEQQRWYAIKIFERDDKVLEKLHLPESTLAHVEKDIQAAEEELDDDAESIITNERYVWIAGAIKGCYKKAKAGELSTSDKIDKIVTNRILALPIFALVMYLVYWIAMGPFVRRYVGTFLTDWTNDVLGGAWLTEGSRAVMEKLGAADWLTGLVADGILQVSVLCSASCPRCWCSSSCSAYLEDIGYMARIAFIMDRIFRRFGLSGKSFIPMLIGSGCGVPGVMASRTIENERDRRMTIMTTCFMPCGAKMPIIGLIAGALFNGSGLCSSIAYFIGIAAIIISGIMLKKTKMFAGDRPPRNGASCLPCSSP